MKKAVSARVRNLRVCGSVQGGDITHQEGSKCNLVAYCGRDYQAAHWKANHKKFCLAPGERTAAAAAKTASPKRAAEEAGEACAVCLESLGEELSPEVLELECKHRFHAECIQDLKASGANALCCPTGGLGVGGLGVGGQNTLCFMQKDTQPSQTCSGGNITPNPTQNRCG